MKMLWPPVHRPSWLRRNAQTLSSAGRQAAATSPVGTFARTAAIGRAATSSTTTSWAGPDATSAGLGRRRLEPAEPVEDLAGEAGDGSLAVQDEVADIVGRRAGKRGSDDLQLLLSSVDALFDHL